MPTTLRVKILGWKLLAGLQGQQNAGREKWRTHLERAEEKPLGGREGVLWGVNKPASSPSSQQRGKLWLTRPETQRREGAALSLSPSVLIPLSCFPQGGGQNRFTPCHDLCAHRPQQHTPQSAVGGQGRKWRWNPGVLLRRRACRVSSQLSPPHPQHCQYQPPSACLRGLPRSCPR